MAAGRDEGKADREKPAEIRKNQCEVAERESA